tara:strand:+ start:351 stop:857 length:507 start_codon:yes stop_codon:yes gene_type:complete
MVDQVDNKKQIEKEYTQLNGANNHSYPIVNIGNELYLKFDVNDGHDIYYSLMIEYEGILIPMGIDLVVLWECKSHLLMQQTEWLYWGYPNGKLEVMHDSWSVLTSFPIFAELTDGSPMRFIEDETLFCRWCGSEKVVYGRKSDRHMRKVNGIATSYDEPQYGCPNWHN